MNFIERVMRVMTHINVGVALGLAACVLWSGWQVVTGQIGPAYRAAEVQALLNHAQGHRPVPMQLVPVQAAAGTRPPCHEEQPAALQATAALPGGDL